MVLIAITLICGIYAVFLFVMLPTYDTRIDIAVHFIIGTALAYSVMFAYLTCCLTPAGSPSPCDDPGELLGERVVQEGKHQVTYINSKYDIAPGIFYKYCSICRCIKPPRTHHCRYELINISTVNGKFTLLNCTVMLSPVHNLTLTPLYDIRVL